MPIYEFKCGKCGEISEEMVPSVTVSIKCKCGGNADKLFNTQVAFTIPEHMRAQCSPSAEKYQHYIKTDPTVREKVNSGEWAIQKGD